MIFYVIFINLHIDFQYSNLWLYFDMNSYYSNLWFFARFSYEIWTRYLKIYMQMDQKNINDMKKDKGRRYYLK